MAVRFCIVVLIGALAGCARHDSPYYRSYVSEGIEERTGHGLASITESGGPSVPESLSLEDGISENEAVALALWNNAAFQETLADLGLARADLIQAGLLSNPVLSLLFPVGPRQLESVLTFSVDALLFRSRRIAVAELQSKHVGERLVQNGLDLVRDVRVAFAGLALAQDRARLAEETAQLLGRIADLSEKRLRAGDVSEFEVATSRIDAIGARADTTNRARDVALARERLRALLGYGSVNADLTFEDAPEAGPVTQDVQTLLSEALAARPDFRSAELATEATGKRKRLARWEFLKLDLILDGDDMVGRGFKVGPGFRIPIPIFNRNQDGVARAEAEFDRAVRHQTTVHDRIMLEVKQAHTRYLQAHENLGILRTQILSQLEEAVRRAEKAYESGNVSYLLVLETTRRHLAARGRELEALAALRRARAELERSVGRRLETE